MKRITLVLGLMAELALPCCGSPVRTDYQALIFPEGTPPLPRFSTREPAPSTFEDLGEVSTADGIIYVLYQLHLAADDGDGDDETHSLGLASVNGTIVKTWDLTPYIPLVAEPGSGAVVDLKGCISFSETASVLHVGLWSLVSGTAGATGVSELFWKLPLNEPDDIEKGVLLKKVGYQERIGTGVERLLDPNVSLALLGGTRIAVLRGQAGDRSAIPLDAPGQQLPVAETDISEEWPVCRLSLEGKPREKESRVSVGHRRR